MGIYDEKLKKKKSELFVWVFFSPPLPMLPPLDFLKQNSILNGSFLLEISGESVSVYLRYYRAGKEKEQVIIRFCS